MSAVRIKLLPDEVVSSLNDQAVELDRSKYSVAEGRTRAEPEQPALVRCSSCLGLRTVSYRNRDSTALCPDCRRGEVVSRETFYAWWLEQFSAEECAAMARAI